jgi:O-antigen ligase
MSGSARTGDTRVLLVGLALLLLLATQGEGGAAAGAMLVWHCLLVGLLLWVLLGPRPEAARPGLPAAAPTTVGVLFLALAATGATLAPYGYAALLTCLELGAFLAVYLLAARFGPELATLLRWPLGAGALIQAALVTWQRIGGDARPAGSFLNTNHMAAWMAMVFLLLIGGLGATRSRTARLASLVLALAPLVGLLLSGSRGALIGLLVGCAWLLATRWTHLPRPFKPALVGVAIVLVLLVGWRQLGRLAEADPFRYQRLRIWRASVTMILESPLWGSGPGQFAVAAKQVQFPDGEGPLQYDRRFSVTHSDPLRAVAEYGAPAALALFASLGLAITTIARRRKVGRLGSRHDGAVAALLAVATQALVDNPSRWPAVYLLSAALLGALLSEARDTPATGYAGKRSWPRALALAVLLLAAFTAADIAPTQAHRLATDARRAGPLIQNDDRVDFAVRLNPLHPGHRMLRAETRIGRGYELTPRRYAASREDAEAAVRLQPADSDYRWGLARIEARGCLELFRDAATRERAKGHFEAAQRLYPTDPRISLDAGEFLLSAGDPAAARRLAERALRIEPNAVPARLLLAESLLELGARDAPSRAAGLLREAREIEAAHTATAAQGRYQQELLAADSRTMIRVEARILAAAAAAPAPAEGTGEP